MQQSDYPRFKALIGRLCDTIGKPMSEELLESYWKSLRNCELREIESRVDDYIARAGENTKFPRPAQLRPDDVAAPVSQDSTNYQRGFWRSLIVNQIAGCLDLTAETLEPVITANRDTLGSWMRVLLEDACRKDSDGSRTEELQALIAHEAGKVAARFSKSAKVIDAYAQDHWHGDNWDIAGNRHFLAHILRRTIARERPYDARATEIMVRWKNKWATDMRDENHGGPVEAAYQREVWGGYLAAGRDEIAANGSPV